MENIYIKYDTCLIHKMPFHICRQDLKMYTSAFKLVLKKVTKVDTQKLVFTTEPPILQVYLHSLNFGSRDPIKTIARDKRTLNRVTP